MDEVCRREKCFMPKIIDVITFNGEYDLFDIRYNILKDYVDKFVVIEFDKTFSGREKPFYGLELDKRFNSWQEKISYHYHSEKIYGKYKELAENSPNTKGAEHWKREFIMKESIKDALEVIRVQDNDIVFIGDCDEIWDKEALEIDNNIKLRLLVYTYYLNNRSNEEFWGTFKGRYGDIRDNCLNHLRSDVHKRSVGSYGWHFTSLKAGLKRKLEDSYTQESYATPQVMNNLEENIKNNRDFLGRNFKYWIDESDWPQYLKENRGKYGHLLKK